LVERIADPLQSDLSSHSQMATQMRDQVWDSQFHTPVDFSDKSLDRLLVELILGTRKIGKIRHVIDYGTEAALLEFFSEALHFFRVERAELPASRIPGEDLESITLLRYRRVYCVVEGLGDGDVDPDSNRKASLVNGSVAV
jgi:hypothetical protein